ncbi:MAG: tRNA (adenosine(37)-N6)-threonylcarbamoyltransferase complex dimerization subunit type 1 TsaB, partial [Candidatus Competibacter sp.]|nr:tRNA (adenosine(37)-N6)-threonylcarbamoyltransferase complex dimerization subunit type 1 TsaB [Candidatus Competibacter sp.]
MKLLALDTATEACSAAVWVDGAVLERYELAPCRHAALILPMIEAVLAEAGLTPLQLDAIAFGRGPGAFTGVRIAVGIA